MVVMVVLVVVVLVVVMVVLMVLLMVVYANNDSGIAWFCPVWTEPHCANGPG